MSTSTQTLGIIVESEGSQLLLRDPDAIRFATDMQAEGRTVRLLVGGGRSRPVTTHVAVSCTKDEVEEVASLTDAPIGVDIVDSACRVYCLADDGALLPMSAAAPPTARAEAISR